MLLVGLAMARECLLQLERYGSVLALSKRRDIVFSCGLWSHLAAITRRIFRPLCLPLAFQRIVINLTLN